MQVGVRCGQVSVGGQHDDVNVVGHDVPQLFLVIEVLHFSLERSEHTLQPVACLHSGEDGGVADVVAEGCSHAFDGNNGCNDAVVDVLGKFRLCVLREVGGNAVLALLAVVGAEECVLDGADVVGVVLDGVVAVP